MVLLNKGCGTMTWTYSGNPGDSPKDEVRYLLGDTVEKNPLLSDEEILYELSKTDSPAKAAYKAGKKALALLAKEISQEVGPFKMKLENRYSQYKQIVDSLENDVKGDLAYPIGATVYPPAPFSLGMHDNYRW